MLYIVIYIIYPRGYVVNWTIRNFNSLSSRFDQEFQGNVRVVVKREAAKKGAFFWPGH